MHNLGHCYPALLNPNVVFPMLSSLIFPVHLHVRFWSWKLLSRLLTLLVYHNELMVSVCSSELVVLPEVEKDMDKWMMLLAVSLFSLVVVTSQVKQGPERASSQPARCSGHLFATGELLCFSFASAVRWLFTFSEALFYPWFSGCICRP